MFLYANNQEPIAAWRLPYMLEYYDYLTKGSRLEVAMLEASELKGQMPERPVRDRGSRHIPKPRRVSGVGDFSPAVSPLPVHFAQLVRRGKIWKCPFCTVKFESLDKLKEHLATYLNVRLRHQFTDYAKFLLRDLDREHLVKRIIERVAVEYASEVYEEMRH